MGRASGSLWREWWWTILFIALMIPAYLHAVKEKKMKVCELGARFSEMLREKDFALNKQEDLRLQIDSQNDPSWIEMVLMRDLGVVPEGWLKVHFKK